MKKYTKIILVFLCLALLAAALVIGSLAAETKSVPTQETNGKFEYINSSGATAVADDLATAVANAKAGTTIKMLGDHYCSRSTQLSITKALTIDFGGHVFAMSQSNTDSSIFAKTSSTVKFMNGTVVASGNSTYGSNRSWGYAFVRPGTTNAKIVFENVNSYTSCLVLDGWTGSINVTINGGEHYLMYHPANMMGGGLVETRLTANVTVNDATIYYGTRDTAVNAQMYNASTPGASTYTFNRCNFISNDGRKSVIGYANQYTKFTFNACNIYGNISTTLSSYDSAKGYTAAGKSNIVLEGGTRIGTTAQFAVDKVSAGAGCSVVPVDEIAIFSPAYATGDLFFDTASETASVFDATFAIGARKNHTYFFSYVFGSDSDYLYAYEIGGKQYYTSSLTDALEYTQGKVYINSSSEITLTADNAIKIAQSGVLDLKGNRVSFVLREGGAIQLLDGVEFTVMNGAISVCTTSEFVDEPLFTVYGEGVKLNINDVDISADNLLDSSSSDLTVNIADSILTATDEHFAANTAPFIISRGAMKLTAERSAIVADLFPTLFSISSDAAEGKTVLEFIDSDVLAIDEDSSIFEYANENTYVILKNSDLFGTLDSTVCPGDKIGSRDAGAMSLAAVTHGAGSRFSGKPEGGNVEAGYVHTTVSERESVEYFDNYGGTLLAYASFTYKVTEAPAAAVATYVSEGLTVATDSIKTAIADCDGGYTVYMLKSVTLTENQKGFVAVTKPITLDLMGNTLEVIQTGEAGISVAANLTVRNGALRTKMTTTETTSSNGTAGASYPLLCYAGSKAGTVVTLENVDTYGGGMIFAYNGTDFECNVIGGTHQVLNRGAGNDNAWINIRCDVEVSITGATFVIAENSAVVADTLWKDTNADDLSSHYVFTDCHFVSEGAKGNVIRNATEYSSFVFNSCYIGAKINPALHNNDKNAGYAAIKAGAIVLGEGTRLASANNISGGVIVTASGTELKNAAYTKSYKYTDFAFNSTETAIVLAAKTVNASFAQVVVKAGQAPITVTFYAEDGKTVIKTYTVNSGDTVTAPSYTPSASNGWVSTTYSGWSETFMGEPTTNFTVTGDVSYYPASVGEITPSLTAALYNISLTGKVSNHLYVPASGTGVNSIGVYDQNGNLLTFYKVRFADGNVYRLYNLGEIGATSLTKETVVTVKYNFLGEAYAQTVTISPYKYATALLKDSASTSPVYPASAHTLVADLVRYSNALAVVTDGNENASLKALLDTYGHLCSELPSFNSFSEYTANTTELNGIISSIQLEVSSTEPRWRFNIAKNAKVSSITVAVDGYYSVIENGVNFGRVEYQATANSNGSAFYTENIPMYNLDRLMTVTVTLSNGTTKVGTYNLDTYFKSFSVLDESIEDVQAFLKAFRAFGISSAGYKYADGIVRDGGFIDKFDCDHENVGPFVAGRGRHCADCNAQVFFYTDYGAVADGVSNRALTASGTNDFEAMYVCHNEANYRAALGFDTIVVAVAHGQTNTNYYIGTPHVVESIVVQTDVDWAGANFIVDDRTVSQSLKNGYYTPVFSVEGDANGRNINYTSKIGAGFASGATNVGFAPGRPMLLYLQNLKYKNYFREGLNANGGQIYQEVILVDEYGNVSPTTPVEYDYLVEKYCKYGCETVDANGDKKCDTCATTISNPIVVKGYAIDDEPIRISGLDKDGSIAFTWENVTDSNVDVSKYDQCQRTIKVTRSNVTVEGIDRYFTEDSSNTTPRQTYAGIVVPQYANNVVIKDMLVYQHLGHYIQENGKNTSNSLGSYEFSGSNSVNVTWLNCRAKNFFNSSGSVTYRGLFGTNYIRNAYLKDCLLTSWDSHSGAYNVTIEDSTFEHINFVGSGDIVIKNTTIYTDGTDAVIHLRQDYGSNWNGNVYIDGLELRYADTGIKAIDLIKAYYTNWYFGMDTYLPGEVYVNDVVIHRFSRSNANITLDENGKIVENITATNAIPLGIYYVLDSKLTYDYDYSTSNINNLDPKVCTKEIHITNCGNLKLDYPDHPFFKDMEITVDGVTQNWYTRRSGLKHTDNDANKICDGCKQTLSCSSTHSTVGKNSGQTCSSCKAYVKKPCSQCADNDADKICDECLEIIKCSATHPTSGTDGAATCDTCGAKIKGESSGGGCVTGDTLVTLADGSVKRADELTLDDLLLVFDHYTGEYTAAPILFIENDGEKEYEVITLTFADGRETKLIYEHAYFDITLGKYVYINADTLYDYIGHEFAVATEDGFESTTLVAVNCETTVSGCYSFVTAWNYNAIVDGFLSIPGGIDGLFNIFEYDESLKFDEEKMAADIEEYGLFDYSDFAEYVPYEIYEAFGAKYFKVAIGKGNLEFETILFYIEKYVIKNGLM